MPDLYRKIKCPHCGWVRTVQLAAEEDLARATVVRGAVGDAAKAMAAKIRAALADAEMDEANAWLDLRPCPHCGNSYRYNPRTGECRR